MEIIARIRSDFPTKFGIPRQSGLADSLISRIIFEPPYRNPDCIKGLEDFSHIWLLWQFTEVHSAKFSPTVRPPRLGGNKRVGVFASRSPFRPNNIALSSVKLEEISYDGKNGPVIYVSGADLLDNTPIIDIKPYLAYTDSHPQAKGGFADAVREYRLEVEFPAQLLELIEPRLRNGLIEVLSEDPRPSYQNDAERIYGFVFAMYEIKFTVAGGILTVRGVEKA